jgi:hypothetical protein
MKMIVVKNSFYKTGKNNYYTYFLHCNKYYFKGSIFQCYDFLPVNKNIDLLILNKHKEKTLLIFNHHN